MLEAMQSLRDDFLSFKKTSSKSEVEVDQTSASASKPGSSKQAVNLDPTPPRPRPTSHTVEDMEVDYGPSLPPRLRDNQSRHDPNTSDQSSDKRHDTDPIHALDHHSGLSDEPTRVALDRPKKHADKRNNKVRSRYVFLFRGGSVLCTQTQVF